MHTKGVDNCLFHCIKCVKHLNTGIKLAYNSNKIVKFMFTLESYIGSNTLK